MKKTISQRAIQAAGGNAKLGRHFNVTAQAVSNWGTRDKIPPEHCVSLCELTGKLFQPHQLRPDIFDETQILG